jgi:hypothetical protein
MESDLDTTAITGDIIRVYIPAKVVVYAHIVAWRQDRSYQSVLHEAVIRGIMAMYREVIIGPPVR